MPYTKVIASAKVTYFLPFYRIYVTFAEAITLVYGMYDVANYTYTLVLIYAMLGMPFYCL